MDRNFTDVLKSSPPDQLYPIIVAVKPDNEEELERKLSKSNLKKSEKLDVINKSYENSMRSLRDYLNNHAIGNVNFLESIYTAICTMKAKDILNLSSQDYVKYLNRSDK